MRATSPRACLLDGRCLIKISGADAEGFLQNLLTNDVARAAPGELVYACLLTPQGRFLHDLFVSRDGDGFFLECETDRREDLLRRLNVFKLRARVTMEDCRDRFEVYVAANRPEGMPVFRDPRLPELGHRFYIPKGGTGVERDAAAAYRDRRIGLGVPEGSPDIKPETDTLANANLDRLNAVSWDKGCYIGQEVTAMTENRGVAKRRMVTISADRLTTGDILTQDGHAVGEVRAVHSSGTNGLAVIKLAGMDKSSGPIASSGGYPVSAQLPEWLKLKNI